MHIIVSNEALFIGHLGHTHTHTHTHTTTAVTYCVYMYILCIENKLNFFELSLYSDPSFVPYIVNIFRIVPVGNHTWEVIT